LNLSETNLTSIPKEIFSFSHLIKLVLDNNEIQDIPNELCDSLLNLQILSLSHNAIRQINTKISNLKQLEVLDLSYNELTEIPIEIGLLDFKLRVLNFNANMIKQIPEQITRLSNLQALELYGNDVEQIPNLTRMNSLFRLNLAANPIVFIAPENLPPNLKHLTSSLPQQIISNLYIGDYTTAAQHKTLKHFGVTHIVSCLADEEPLFPEMFKYHMVNLNDDEKEDLLVMIPNSHQFIEEALKKGGVVFVHCAVSLLLILIELILKLIFF